MPELFEFPPSRSNRAKWALEELGIDYSSRLIDFMKGEQQTNAHKTVHPLGHVPVYRTNEYVMYESVAIVMQLLDEHPHRGFAPRIGTAERSQYYQWCVFASAELDPALSDVMKHTMHLPEDQRVPEIAERARDWFDARAEVLSAALQDHRYLLGDAFFGSRHRHRVRLRLGGVHRPNSEATHD